jgi:dienelactone hydrolase
MKARGATLLAIALLATGCATATVRFDNATPNRPLRVVATEYAPRGAGPFPAVIAMHGCIGVSTVVHAWARFLRDNGYVALIVDSWTPRGLGDNCDAGAVDVPNTERFDDMVGALRWLHARPYVDRDRVGIVGWSSGGVYAMASVNGPSLARARARGVLVPEPGVRAAIAFYPGGCFSLVNELVVRPLLVLMGDADDWTIPGPCVQMADAMRRRGADVTLVLYPGAYHYFDDPGQPRSVLAGVANRNKPGECCGATVGHDGAAFADSRRRVLEFFGYHLGVRTGR